MGRLAQVTGGLIGALRARDVIFDLAATEGDRNMLTESPAQAERQVVRDLERDGIVVLPAFASGARLAGMQSAFGRVLGRLRVNVASGYEKTEVHRDMVEDVLMLDQGFVDAALAPVVQETLREYIGPEFQLAEARGWLSRPTRRDFHGWHGDEWYDQTKVRDRIPREVKLALYLTDVETGNFEYLRGSHQQNAPRIFRNTEIGTGVQGEIIRVRGPAGTAFLFDTSGVHRQGVPILKPRHAVFYNYHETSVPLQAADVKGNRYRPLLLNAAFLGGLSDEDRRILGFGDKNHYIADHVPRSPAPSLDRLYERQLRLGLAVRDFRIRLGGRLKRIFRG